MTGGDVYTIAGQANGQAGCQCDGRLATSGYLDDPWGIVIDAAGDLYIADTGNNRIQEVPAANGTQWGQTVTAGYMYTIAGAQYGTSGYTGDGGAASAALLNYPNALVMDGAGDIYISDSHNNRVQEIAASTGTQRGQSMTAGDIYTIAGNQYSTSGATGDGGPGGAALLYGVGGLALDSAGDLYIGDGGNNRVQELAAVTRAQWGQSMTAGNIYTVTGGAAATLHADGGPATATIIAGAPSLAIDSSSDLYIADEQNNRIQEIAGVTGTQWGQSMTAGDEYTVAGSAGSTSGNSGDGGPATSALMANTQSISLDPENDLYITDSANATVREVASATANAIAPAPGQASALVIAPAGTAPGGITVTQPGGAQVTFWAQTGGTCATGYVVTGSYCVLPQDQGTTLTYNSGTGIYTYSPGPGSLTYTYHLSGATGTLTGETDTAGDTLTITNNSPAPGVAVTGNGTCPATAGSCQTITSASGRALILGYSGTSNTGQVTSATDPMNRTWTYGYNTAGQLTSATDPMGHVTSYAYGSGATGNPLLASDLTTITSPNAQPGGPDAGDATVNVYDSSGRVTSQTDPMGVVTTFNYCVSATAGDCMNTATGTGEVTITGTGGDTTVDSYTQGVLTAETALNGSTAQETDYGPALTAAGAVAGTLLNSWETDAAGNETSYTYDSVGNPTSVTDPMSNTTTTASTSLSAVSCSADATAASPCSASQTGPPPVAPGIAITPPSSAPPSGVSYSLYDTSGHELYETTGVYPAGSSTASSVQTTYTLYRGNSVTLNGTNITCAATPPSPSLPCAEIDPNGIVTRLAYDSAGDLTSESVPDGNGSELATITNAYNGDGQPTSVTSVDGNLPGANAGNYTTVTAYNSGGETTSVTQAGGSGATVTPRITSYGYDADGHRTTVTDPGGHTTTTTYDADDESVMVTDADQHASLTCYDDAGRVAQTVPPAGVAAAGLTATSCPTNYPAAYGTQLAPDATAYTFNQLSQATSVTSPAPAGQTGSQTTTMTYTATGLTATESFPPPSNSPGAPREVVSSTYDANGQLLTKTTGVGTTAPAVTSYCYDPNGSQTSVVTPDGNVSGTAACETSSPWVVNATTYPTQAGHQTTSSRNSAGQLVSSTAPATAAAPGGATTTLTYDTAGNTLTSTNPDGVTTTWTYNTAGRATGVSYSGSSAHSVSYAYGADGQLTGMTDGTGTSSYAFDPFGELASVTNGVGKTVGYGYNADGATTSATYPLPATATWATSDTVSYGYDNAGLMTSVTDFNGNKITIGNTADGLPSSRALGSTGDTISTVYDQTGVPSEIDVKNSTSTLLGFSYADAPSGVILSETDTPSSAKTPAAYTYDQFGRVTSATLGSGTAANYGYSPSGNLTTTPTGATGGYDNAGELTSTTLSGTTTNYAYDASGQRLTAKQGSTTISSGTWDGSGALASYSDPAAAMTAATYDGNGLRASATTGGTTQNFTWDGSQLLMDSGNAYIYGTGTTPAEQVNLATGQVSYLATDHLGSVRAVIASTGSISASTSYDAWGNPETAGGLTSYSPFGYAGGYTDATGLIYLINRYYDPVTGQFLSVDPADAATGQPYAYANGNPVSLTDPTGLWAATLFTGVPYASEATFQAWVGALFGVPPKGPGWEYQTWWQAGTPSSVTKYGTRRIDIYSYDWSNEVKTGYTSLTSPSKGDKSGTIGEAYRDSYIDRTGGHAACVYKNLVSCSSIQVNGTIWWFSAKGTSGCQTPISLKGGGIGYRKCASGPLQSYLNSKKNLNQVYVYLEPERYRETAKSFYNTKGKRAAVRSALLQNSCGDVRNSLSVLGQGPEVQIPYWKYGGVQC